MVSPLFHLRTFSLSDFARRLARRTLDAVNFRAPLAVVLPLLALAWLWFRLLDHLRVEWTVNPQYHYGWAVPVLCLYLAWRGKRAAGESAPSASPPRAVAASSLDPCSSLEGRGFVAGGLFVVLSLAYLPTRLITEANPEWRLAAVAQSPAAIGRALTWLTAYGPCPVRTRCLSSSARADLAASRSGYPHTAT